MKVERLELEDFTAFEDVQFEFCPGINVFIGANSTGKTHVMKAIYTLLKVCEQVHLKEISSKEKIEEMVQEKLQGVFKPDSLGRLVRRGKGRHSGEIHLVYAGLSLKMNLTTQSNVHLEYDKLLRPESSVYLPAREFLSINEGFIAAYLKRETAFDETFFDLSVALNSQPLSAGRRETEIKDLVEPLEKVIGGKVTQKQGRFYVRLSEGNLEAPLVSEGYLKLGGLIYLINNGSLTQNGVLFWDEPEANLNPKAVSVVVKVLRTLAASGVQIFIATHDYLLSQKLSLLVEYPSDTDAAVKFFSLFKPNRRKGVQVEAGDTLVDIEHNPILEEFAAHYDQELELFRKASSEDMDEA
ncbi:MAG: AAA family ATPase [Anaerolineales bacterium]